MVRDLNNSEEVKDAILAALLNKGGSVSLVDSLAFAYDKEGSTCTRSVQVANSNLVFTINLDSKKSVSKKVAEKVANFLLDLSGRVDFTFEPNRHLINNIARLLEKEKAVKSIICKNDFFAYFSDIIEDVIYIIDGVHFKKVKGDKSNCFVHVQYENLAEKVDKKYAVMCVNSAGDYAVCDPVKERFYYTLNPLATLLKLTK